MSTYVVTGAAGFIGSNLVEALLKQNHTVIGFDNLSTGDKSNLDFVNQLPTKSNFKFIEGDIRNIDQCMDVCKGADYVLHQAALGSVPRSMEQPALYNDNNITGTLNMLIAARDAKVKRFVFASSSSVYGDTPTLPKIETMIPSPKSPYAISKITGEYYCKVFWTAYGLPTISLRYFNIFGPRQNPNSQYAAVIPKFITSYLKNQSPTIHGDGQQTRDFTFVQNAVKANLGACLASPEAFGQAINIGCGDRISLNMLSDKIKEITHSTATPVYTPSRPGDVKDSLASNDLATTYLQIAPWTEMAEGLQQTISWYSSQLVK
jgi:nucleoside-diphosphate-sugar epimerase